MAVTVSFLGGLGEIGRNCAAIEIEDRICLVDVGLMFPEEDMLGVDLVFPDWSWLVKRRRDVECVILTHGHLDSHLLRDIDCDRWVMACASCDVGSAGAGIV